MRLLDSLHIRSRSRPRNKADERDGERPPPSPGLPPQYATGRQSMKVGRLPAKVLDAIFLRVCPHAGDETYRTAEETTGDEGCLLCDTRDLAACMQVNRMWAVEAQQALSVEKPVHSDTPRAVLTGSPATGAYGSRPSTSASARSTCPRSGSTGTGSTATATQRTRRRRG